MKSNVLKSTLAAVAVAASVSSAAADAPATPSAAKPTIVLVHGAFADASAWQKVIPLLQRQGFNAVAVQNTLTSFADDVATTRRVIEAQSGPVVAVGHSYGGAVITAAAAGNANVKSLVYVAALVPEANEKIGDLYNRNGPAPLGPALIPDAAGFLTIDRAKFHEGFAHDVSEADARVLAATQKPIHNGAFDGSVESPAWKTIPSFYLLASEDRAILPPLQRFMAERIGARIVEVKASHVPFLSNPAAVAALIEQAAH